MWLLGGSGWLLGFCCVVNFLGCSQWLLCLCFSGAEILLILDHNSEALLFILKLNKM